MKVLHGAVLYASFMAVILVVAGCRKEAGKAPSGTGPGPGKFGPGSGLPPRERGPIGEIMAKLNGEQSLTTVIGEELQVDPPPWDKLQPRTKEFVTLAASMGKHEPTRGSRESWAKLTAAYSDTAVALDKAVQAKDKAAALVAHQTLSASTSCKACHIEHRAMGPAGFGKLPGSVGGPKGPGGGAPPPDDKPAPPPNKDKEK
jgi:hypothetical protein